MQASLIISTYSISKLKNLLATIKKCAKNNIEIVITVERDKKYFNLLVKNIKKLKKGNNFTAKIIFHEKRLSISQARNLGLQSSTGKILIFLDDDAIPIKQCIKEIIKTYEERKDAAIIGGNIKLNIPSKYIFPKIFYTLLGGIYVPPSNRKIIETRNVIACILSVKREILNEIGGFCNLLYFSRSLGAFYGNIGGEDVELSKRIWVHYKGRKKVYLNKEAQVYHIISREKILPWNILKRAFFLFMIDEIVNDILKTTYSEKDLKAAQKVINRLEKQQLKDVLKTVKNLLKFTPRNVLEFFTASLLFFTALVGKLFYKIFLKSKFNELIRKNKKHMYDFSSIPKLAKVAEIAII